MKSRRVLQDAGREDHEEVQVEAAPIHLAQAGQAGAHRHTLHIERDLIAQFHSEILRQLRFERERHWTRGIGRPRQPLAGDERLRGVQMVAIRRPKLPPQHPLRDLAFLLQVTYWHAAHG